MQRVAGDWRFAPPEVCMPNSRPWLETFGRAGFATTVLSGGDLPVCELLDALGSSSSVPSFKPSAAMDRFLSRLILKTTQMLKEAPSIWNPKA